MTHPALLLLGWAAWCLACDGAAADPMRPLLPPGKPASVAVGAAIPAIPAVPAAPAARQASGRLIAIRQDSRGQRQALIGESWVAVGDQVDELFVAAIGANHVDLIEGKSGKNPTRSTLHLLPPLQASVDTPANATQLADAARGKAAPRAGSTP